MARISVNRDASVPLSTAEAPRPQPIIPETQSDTVQEEALSLVDEELKHKSSTSPFSAFCAFPGGWSFAGEEKNEQIVLLLRAHFITNLYWVIISILLCLIPFLVVQVFLLIKNLFSFLTVSLSPNTLMIIGVFWYLLIFTYAFLKFLYWYFNVYIITNERLVDVDWYSVVYHRTSTALLSKVEDVTFTQIGVLPGLFDYGTIIVQTAGEETNIDFTDIPCPQIVVQKINSLVREEEKQ